MFEKIMRKMGYIKIPPTISRAEIYSPNVRGDTELFFYPIRLSMLKISVRRGVVAIDEIDGARQ